MTSNYIYKISDGEYLGRSCNPTRNIYLCETDTHKTTYLFDSDESIEDIIKQIKEHRDIYLSGVFCEIQYSESEVTTRAI